MKTFLCLCFIFVDISASYPYTGSMTFTSGDTIATHSFAEDHRRSQGRSRFDLEMDPWLEKKTPQLEQKTPQFEQIPIEVESTSVRTKDIPIKPSQGRESEEEEDTSSFWSFMKKNNVPSFNAFFPVIFGGTSGSTRSGGEGFYPGTATAIANSFSTGKGGVATSHATSFGDPYLSMLFRNGYFNKKKQ